MFGEKDKLKEANICGKTIKERELRKQKWGLCYAWTGRKLGNMKSTGERKSNGKGRQKLLLNWVLGKLELLELLGINTFAYVNYFITT